MPNPCSRGCKNPDGSPKAHVRIAECPVYQNELKARQASAAAKPPIDRPATPGPTPVGPGPSGPVTAGAVAGSIGFKDGAAEVRKGSNKPTPAPEPVDFSIDEPHTKTIWSGGYRVVKFGTYLLDDYLQTDQIHREGFSRHIPDKLFRLNETELDAIAGDPVGNPFTRFGTWVCKRAGAKTRGQAHAMIDTANFGMLFGGLLYAVIDHYRVALKFSPKLLALRAEKKEKASAAAAAREAELALRAGAPARPAGATA